MSRGDSLTDSCATLARGRSVGHGHASAMRVKNAPRAGGIELGYRCTARSADRSQQMCAVLIRSRHRPSRMCAHERQNLSTYLARL
jgi:hypothetical protein